MSIVVRNTPRADKATVDRLLTSGTVALLVLLGAFQMFVLGMIGEYLGRLYVESKRRPLYLVSDVAGPVQGRATLGYRAEPRAGDANVTIDRPGESGTLPIR